MKKSETEFLPKQPVLAHNHFDKVISEAINAGVYRAYFEEAVKRSSKLLKTLSDEEFDALGAEFFSFLNQCSPSNNSSKGSLLKPRVVRHQAPPSLLQMLRQGQRAKVSDDNWELLRQKTRGPSEVELSDHLSRSSTPVPQNQNIVS